MKSGWGACAVRNFVSHAIGNCRRIRSAPFATLFPTQFEIARDLGVRRSQRCFPCNSKLEAIDLEVRRGPSEH